MIASDRKSRETIAIPGLKKRRQAAKALAATSPKADPDIGNFEWSQSNR
jgi:hypothetical protein